MPIVLLSYICKKKSENEGWERQINGLSNNEKANLLLEKHTFKELLADVEQRNLQNNIVGLEASRLFCPVRNKHGRRCFPGFTICDVEA